MIIIISLYYICGVGVGGGEKNMPRRVTCQYINSHVQMHYIEQLTTQKLVRYAKITANVFYAYFDNFTMRSCIVFRIL